MVDKKNACNQCRKQQDGSGYVCYVPAPVLADIYGNTVAAFNPVVSIVLVGYCDTVSSGREHREGETAVGIDDSLLVPVAYCIPESIGLEYIVRIGADIYEH